MSLAESFSLLFSFGAFLIALLALVISLVKRK
ncbi:putative holin-like toxin [Gracilibacillus salinarum]|uniref:Holin-like toxin n=1 Tax=Gracilibacillus salinarum TaxID=2932255 RepID=A0ABY4GH64_9BACI|nr:putative holin-like toxin [Gracilibacillus salinarum]UOQ83550.1 putative holin-like toxin [Gracilibacillus salinarum]